MKAVKAGRPVEFSGVTVIPQWDWTPDYARLVAESYRKPRSTQADYEAIADRYAIWLAARDGSPIKLPEDAPYDAVLHFECHWGYRKVGRRYLRSHIESVAYSMRRGGRWGQPGEFMCSLAEIQIPNPERDRPQVLESTEEAATANPTPTLAAWLEAA